MVLALSWSGCPSRGGPPLCVAIPGGAWGHFYGGGGGDFQKIGSQFLAPFSKLLLTFFWVIFKVCVDNFWGVPPSVFPPGVFPHFPLAPFRAPLRV